MLSLARLRDQDTCGCPRVLCNFDLSDANYKSSVQALEASRKLWEKEMEDACNVNIYCWFYVLL